MPQLVRRSLSFGEGGLFVALAPGEGASAIASFRLKFSRGLERGPALDRC